MDHKYRRSNRQGEKALFTKFCDTKSGKGKKGLVLESHDSHSGGKKGLFHNKKEGGEGGGKGDLDRKITSREKKGGRSERRVGLSRTGEEKKKRDLPTPAGREKKIKGGGRAFNLTEKESPLPLLFLKREKGGSFLSK